MPAGDFGKTEDSSFYANSNVIEGEKGEVCLNGAAARHVQKGDTVIIVAYASMDIEEAKIFEPTVVFVDDKNRFKEIRKEIQKGK